MSEQLQIEATGETVGEAKWSALRELEKLQPGSTRRRSSSRSSPRASAAARRRFRAGPVIATFADGRRLTARLTAADESELAATVRELLDGSSRDRRARALTIEEDDETLTPPSPARPRSADRQARADDRRDPVPRERDRLSRPGRGPEGDRRRRGGYRERRKATLDALAVRSAERAVSSGQRVELEPMTAVERKVVHVRLKDYPGVTTASEGTEPNRFVVIARGWMSGSSAG
jgi:hypothetical protein